MCLVLIRRRRSHVGTAANPVVIRPGVQSLVTRSGSQMLARSGMNRGRKQRQEMRNPNLHSRPGEINGHHQPMADQPFVTSMAYHTLGVRRRRTACSVDGTPLIPPAITLREPLIPPTTSSEFVPRMNWCWRIKPLDRRPPRISHRLNHRPCLRRLRLRWN